jgi:hypothetical protein
MTTGIKIFSLKQMVRIGTQVTINLDLVEMSKKSRAVTAQEEAEEAKRSIRIEIVIQNIDLNKNI